MKRILEYDSFNVHKEMQEPIVVKTNTYVYRIHQNDEEHFLSDVRSESGRIVYSMKKRDFGKDRPMRDVNDLKGLRSLLIAKGLMRKQDVLKKYNQE